MRYAVKHDGETYPHTSAAVAGLHAQQLADDTGRPAKVLQYLNGRWQVMAKITSCNVQQSGTLSLTTDVRGREIDPADAVELCDGLQGTRHEGFDPSDL